MANLNFNKVIMAGRVVRNIELKTTPDGVSVCNLCIAVNKRSKNAGANFFNCVAWRSTAEFISKYFTKGSSICIEGILDTREYYVNDQKRTATEIVVDSAYFVDSASEKPAQSSDEPTFESLQDDEDDLPF